MAAQHQRHLLRLGPRGQATHPGEHEARLPDVCQVLSRRPPRGLRARRQSVRHRPRERRRDRPHGRRRGERHQRHLRLGVRGGARSARRVPVEPRREAHRVLAARPVGHPAVLPREPGLALPAARPRALPQSRHAELRGEDRRDRARLRPYHVGGPRGGAGHLHRGARLRRLARRGLAHPPEPSPEPARPVVGRCTHGRVARGHDGSRFRLGGRTPAAVDQRRPAVSVPIRSGRIHAGVSLQPRRLVRAPRDPGGLGRARAVRRGRAGEAALFHRRDRRPARPARAWPG